MFTHIPKAHVACDVNCLIETEGRFKVTGSHVHLHCAWGTISETVRDREVVTTNKTTNRKCCVAYGIAANPMTLSDLQGRAPVSVLLKCDLSYSCAAVDKISSDVASGAVPV